MNKLLYFYLIPWNGYDKNIFNYIPGDLSSLPSYDVMAYCPFTNCWETEALLSSTFIKGIYLCMDIYI